MQTTQGHMKSSSGQSFGCEISAIHHQHIDIICDKVL